MLPEFSNVVHILEVIPATMCSAERSFNALRRLKTDQRSTIGQQYVSNIEPVNIESAYANSVVNNVMDRITDISSAIGVQRQLFLLTCFVSYMIDSHIRLFLLDMLTVGQCWYIL